MPVNLLLRKEYENLFVSHAILIFMNSIINLQKILVVVPAPIHPAIKKNESIMADFGDRGYEISLKLKDTYKDITDEYQ